MDDEMEIDSVPAESDAERAARVVGSPSSLEGSDENRSAYISQLIELAKDDALHVRMASAFSIGVVVVVMTQIPIAEIRSLPTWARVLVSIGIAACGLGSASFFVYHRRLHRVRMQLVRCVPSIDAERARELWAGSAGVWARNRWYYIAGRTMVATGLVALALGMSRLLWVA